MFISDGILACLITREKKDIIIDMFSILLMQINSKKGFH